VSSQPGKPKAIMSRLLKRHRKFLSASVLGLWTFALFVGFANACSWDGVTAVQHQPTMAGHAAVDAADHDTDPGCDEFCSNDIPLLSVLQLTQGPLAGQPLVVATHYDLGNQPASAPAFRLAWTARPSPGASFSFHIVRLTL
jgi:hypothetical protein